MRALPALLAFAALACREAPPTPVLSGPEEIAPTETGTWTCSADTLPDGAAFVFTVSDFPKPHARADHTRIAALRGTSAALSLDVGAFSGTFSVTCAIAVDGASGAATRPLETRCGQARLTRRLTVDPGGMTRVTSDPPGIDCPGTCRAVFPVRTVVRLHAEPPAGRVVDEWSEGCSAGVVRLDSDAECAPGLALPPEPETGGLRLRAVLPLATWIVRWAPRAGLLAAFDPANRTLRRWRDGQPLPPVLLPAPAENIEISPDGSRVLLLQPGSPAVVVNALEEAPSPVVPPAPLPAATVAAFSDDGELALASDGLVTRLETATLAVRSMLRHAAPVRSLAYFPGGHRLVALTLGTLEALDDGPGGLPPGNVSAFALSPDGATYAAAFAGPGVAVFRTSDSRELARALPFSDGLPSRIAFSADGELVYVGGSGDRPAGLGTWRWRSSTSVARLPDGDGGASSQAVNPVDGTVAIGGAGVAVRRPDGSRLSLLHAPWSNRGFMWAPDGRSIFTLGRDGVDELDASTLELRRTLFADEQFEDFAVAPDGRTFALASAALSQEIVLRTLGSDVRRVLGNVRSTAIAFVDGAQQVMVPSLFDASFFDLARATERKLPVAIPSLEFLSPDGALLLAGPALVDVATGVVVRSFPARRSAPQDQQRAAWALDGAVIATHDGSFTMSLWDANLMTPLASPRTVLADDFAAVPHRPLLVVGRAGRVELVDLADGSTVASADLPADMRLESVRVSPDGSAVAAAGIEGTIAVWDVLP